jgi:hypothetical protein
MVAGQHPDRNMSKDAQMVAFATHVYDLATGETRFLTAGDRELGRR